jgi:hypothetical protein
MGGIGLIDIDSFCSLSNREFMDSELWNRIVHFRVGR